MEKLTETQLELLKMPLPTEAITQHPTKTYLSSIKAIYVTERMNDVFGVGAWQTRIKRIEVTEKGMVIVKVKFSVPQYGIFYECFGGNDNGSEASKNFDLGDAYKGATTDAITKIGSYLGIGIDVFKGKIKKTFSTTNQELPWLNILDKDKNFTPAWLKIMALKSAGTPKSVDDLKKVYRISKEVEAKINEL